MGPNLARKRQEAEAARIIRERNQSMVAVINSRDQFDEYVRDLGAVVAWFSSGEHLIREHVWNTANAYQSLFFMQVEMTSFPDICQDCGVTQAPTFVFFLNGQHQRTLVTGDNNTLSQACGEAAAANEQWATGLPSADEAAESTEQY